MSPKLAPKLAPKTWSKVPIFFKCVDSFKSNKVANPGPTKLKKNQPSKQKIYWFFEMVEDCWSKLAVPIQLKNCSATRKSNEHSKFLLKNANWALESKAETFCSATVVCITALNLFTGRRTIGIFCLCSLQFSFSEALFWAPAQLFFLSKRVHKWASMLQKRMPSKGPFSGLNVNAISVPIGRIVHKLMVFQVCFWECRKLQLTAACEWGFDRVLNLQNLWKFRRKALKVAQLGVNQCRAPNWQLESVGGQVWVLQWFETWKEGACTYFGWLVKALNWFLSISRIGFKICQVVSLSQPYSRNSQLPGC